MDDKIIVIFSGFNQRAVIAFLRTLDKANIPYVIIAKSSDDTIFDTDYKNNVCFVRDKAELDLNQFIYIFEKIKKIKQKKYLFITPSTEALNRFLLENKNVFEQENIIIPLVDKDLYNRISDKYSFCQLCEEYKINIPQSKRDYNGIEIPFVAKPYTYSTDKNEIFAPQLIYTLEDKERFETKYNIQNFYYQEFITGHSYYLLYYFDKEGNITKFSQQNLIQQPRGKSIIAAIPATIHNEEISEKFEYMLKSIKFRGLIMIEIKKKDDKFYMIEANPRFWGPSQLFVDLNINFFEFLLFDYDIVKKKPSCTNLDLDSRYFWYGGAIEANKKRVPIIYHIDNIFDLNQELYTWLVHDIYKRYDTIKIFEKETKMTTKDKLIALYTHNSKHSNYQILSNKLSQIIGNNELKIQTRYESERLEYILNNISIKDQSILDIGGNSGFFSFEVLERGAKDVLFYEGNKNHAEFVDLAAETLELEEKIRVINKYFEFEDELNNIKIDVTLLLNVLHHLGDDYGDSEISISNAKIEIINQLNAMAIKTKFMIFQLGFNWKGNSNLGLFSNGTKLELIDFVKKNIQEHWDIINIGIAVRDNDSIEYKNLDDENIKRDDSLGEFLNRPLFILKSKKWMNS